MKKVQQYTIRTTEKTDIFIGTDILTTVGSMIKKYSYSKVVILTDEIPQKLFLPQIQKSLDQEHIPFAVITIPSGEKSKDFATLQEILSQCYSEHVDRKSAIIALGGGVVGDIATLAAALYYRGIDCIQIPTTLLSQVDSALGGKGAVDLGTHKNTIGIIRQPRIVITDTNTLASLPDIQIRSGMGEIIKYAIAMDSELFTLLMDKHASDHLKEIVSRCIALKMNIVQKDPQDITTQRAVVNFGHTLGQAIELNTSLTHGEAIAVGMTFIVKLSKKLQMISSEEAKKAIALLQKYQLPTSITGIDSEKALQQMKKDKKSIGGVTRFVLLEEIGKTKQNCIVDENIVRSVLSEVLL